jgi:hypothetical protein
LRKDPVIKLPARLEPMRLPQVLICDPAIVLISKALAAAYKVARTSLSPAFRELASLFHLFSAK